MSGTHLFLNPTMQVYLRYVPGCAQMLVDNHKLVDSIQSTTENFKKNTVPIFSIF